MIFHGHRTATNGGSPEDGNVVVKNEAQRVAAKALKRKFKLRSRTGLSLLVVGFLLQLLRGWCQR